MTQKNQFSKYANHYNSHNIIQQLVAKSIVRDVNFEAKNILELGCGSGQVIKHIPWEFESYTAIDSSASMCELHPKDLNINVQCYNFDDDSFYDFIKNKRYDLILSSSAMQWSKDLDKLLNALSKISSNIVAGLFTSNTFKTIQTISKQKSPILDETTIKDAFSKYYNCEFETHKYNLEFENKKDLFDYIKKSGVSGENELSYKDAKRLYKEYNLNYLEFEVIFIKAFSRV